MKGKIVIINGPNLNLLGKREPHVYGIENFDEYLDRLKTLFPEIIIEYFQSNIEGELVDCIQQSSEDSMGIVLNAASYTHTSVALHDAILAIDCQVVEVHISNIYNRESFRHQSLISSACIGVITGFGLKSYELAIQSLV